jgi:hypothetical protein
MSQLLERGNSRRLEAKLEVESTAEMIRHVRPAIWQTSTENRYPWALR